MTVVFFMLIFVFVFTGCSSAVATVDDMKINRDEVDQYLNFLEKQAEKSQVELTDEDIKELEINIIDSLIMVKLLDRYAEENGITVTGEDVNQQIEQIVQSYESETEFEEDIKSMGINREFLENEIRNQIIQSKVYGENTADIIVTDEQVREYYEENKSTLFTTPTRIRVSHILAKFPWIDDQGEETAEGRTEAREKIEFVKEKLDDGAEFGDMARQYSDDSATSTDGGDLGFISKGQMVEEFEKEVFSLKVGDTSDIVETEFGYHLIKVFDREEERLQEFEEVKEGINSTLLNLYRSEKWQTFLFSLIENAKIEYLTEAEGTLNEKPGEDNADTGQEPSGEGEDSEADGGGTSDDQMIQDEELEEFLEDGN